MARRNSRKKAYEPTRLEWLLESTAWLRERRVLIGISWTLGVLALLGAWTFGVPRLAAYASTHHAAPHVMARFKSIPPWADGEIAEELIKTAEATLSSDPLRRNDLVATRDALLASGWFAAIPQVRRVEPGLIEIEAQFARPFMAMHDPQTGVDHLLDTDGRLLPRTYVPGTAPFMTVVGARRMTRGDGWTAIDAADQHAVYAVAQLLLSRKWNGQVSRIVIDRDADEVLLSLETDRGCKIIWGRTPGTEMGREVPAQRKIEYLDYHYSQYGRIDRGFLTEIDVTGDVVIGR